MVHSLLAVEIGLDDLGGALGGQRGTGDGGFFGGVELGRALQGLGRPPQPITLQPAGIAGVRQALKSTWTTYLHMGSYCLRARDNTCLRHVFYFSSSRLLLYMNCQSTIPPAAFPQERTLRDATQKDGSYFLRYSARKLPRHTHIPPSRVLSNQLFHTS